MRLDARIPVRIVPSPDWPPVLPPADAQAVLLIAGPAALDFEPERERVAGWAAVRWIGLNDAPDAPGVRSHVAGCVCCAISRPPLARMLSGLFEARARGTLGLFRRVWLLAPRSAVAELEALLASDALVAGRYRVGEN